ncbi:MAG: rRNA maturation RNase YbeY [Candidatus Neomarinimicrobiota bacterium]
MIKIQVDSDPEITSPDENSARSIIKTVLADNQIKAGSISLIFGNDELLSALKQKFFKLKQFTDVIAFRLNDYKDKDPEGELYISLPRAKENARTFGEPFAREIARLLIHGTLHLLNYKDDTETDKKDMEKREEKYLNQVNWKELI